MGDIVQRLREVTEQEFDCQHGLQQAFFELPQRGAESIRVTYVVYAFKGNDLNVLEQAMIDEVIVPLSQKAGADAMLYWRLTDCYQVDVIDDGEHYMLRTRIAVLDKDLNAVTLPDVVKTEGARVQTR